MQSEKVMKTFRLQNNTFRHEKHLQLMPLDNFSMASQRKASICFVQLSFFDGIRFCFLLELFEC